MLKDILIMNEKKHNLKSFDEGGWLLPIEFNILDFIPKRVFIVNDVPGGIDSNSVTQAYTTLISDNINKIPPDLGEVQPEQTQFRTSDELLYPRVLTSLCSSRFTYRR